MAQGVKVPPDTRSRVVQLLGDGASVGEASRAAGVSKGTASLIASQAGLQLDRSRTERLTAAAQDFNQARQLELLNEVARVAGELLSGPLTPHQLQALALSLAIVVDKRRLIDGVATQRTESQGIIVYLPQKGSIATIDAHLALPQARLEAGPDDEAFPALSGPHQTEGSDG